MMPTDEGDINPVEWLVRVKDNTGDVIANIIDVEHAEDLFKEEEEDGEEAMIGGSDSDEECGMVGWNGVAMPSPLPPCTQASSSGTLLH